MNPSKAARNRPSIIRLLAISSVIVGLFPSVLKSQVPPYSFEFASNIGVLDKAGEFHPPTFYRGNFFPNWYFKNLLNRSRPPLYSQIYFRFQIRETASHLQIQLQSTPGASEVVRVFNVSHVQIVEIQDRTIANIPLTTGDYFIEVLTLPGSATQANGTNQYELYVNAVPDPPAQYGGTFGAPLVVGRLSQPNDSVTFSGALTSRIQRGPPTSDSCELPPANPGFMIDDHVNQFFRTEIDGTTEHAVRISTNGALNTSSYMVQQGGIITWGTLPSNSTQDVRLPPGPAVLRLSTATGVAGTSDDEYVKFSFSVQLLQ